MPDIYTFTKTRIKLRLKFLQLFISKELYAQVLKEVKEQYDSDVKQMDINDFYFKYKELFK